MNLQIRSQIFRIHTNRSIFIDSRIEGRIIYHFPWKRKEKKKERRNIYVFILLYQKIAFRLICIVSNSIIFIHRYIHHLYNSFFFQLFFTFPFFFLSNFFFYHFLFFLSFHILVYDKYIRYNKFQCKLRVVIIIIHLYLYRYTYIRTEKEQLQSNIRVYSSIYLFIYIVCRKET